MNWEESTADEAVFRLAADWATKIEPGIANEAEKADLADWLSSDTTHALAFARMINILHRSEDFSCDRVPESSHVQARNWRFPSFWLPSSAQLTASIVAVAAILYLSLSNLGCDNSQLLSAAEYDANGPNLCVGDKDINQVSFYLRLGAQSQQEFIPIF